MTLTARPAGVITYEGEAYAVHRDSAKSISGSAKGSILPPPSFNNPFYDKDRFQWTPV